MDLRAVDPERADASRRLSLPDMLGLHRVESAEGDVFEGPVTSNLGPRVFGGQVFGQAVVAGARTFPDSSRLHHASAQFLRPADGRACLRFHVEVLRDGRAFAQRIVRAVQHDRVVLFAVVSGHVSEPGYAHQISRFEGPGPLDSPTAEQWFADWPEHARRTALMATELGLDLRFPAAPTRVATLRGDITTPTQSVWMRSRDRLPDLPDGRPDPVLHAGALAYLSDLLLLSSSLGPHRRTMYDEGLQFATINHSLWMHEQVRLDDWVRYEQVTPWMGHGTSLGRGEIFATDGRLVGSVGQEGLVRVTGESVPSQ